MSTLQEQMAEEIKKLSFEDACTLLAIGGPLPEDQLYDYWKATVPDLNRRRLLECANALIRSANTHPNPNVGTILLQYSNYARKLAKQERFG